jgi:phenylacetate-CoA ligase
MGIDFRVRDFAYPIAVLRLKRVFDKNQWLDEKRLHDYQLSLLKTILHHAYNNVPYYHDIFDSINMLPDDIKTVEDLKKIPVLTKDTLRTSAVSLTAKDSAKYRPKAISTSGTTGGNVRFLTDSRSNILEFVFYWRYWGWAGYRIGDTFAEFSAQHFTPFEENKNVFFDFEHVTRRLILNSLLISPENSAPFIEIFAKFRPLFLKGLPSNLYAFALALRKRKGHGIKIKAVFSQGENLLGFQRDLIEKAFGCRAYDSYGHMERTVAISQCPLGSYHVHSDYGVAEFEGPGEIKEIIGTSLYNLSMPLIRYKTGDYVKIQNPHKKCNCGRNFPVIDSIIGRETDIIFTPEGRAITALYVAFDRTPGIVFGQIIQESIDRLVLRIATDSRDKQMFERVLINNVRDFVGDSMKIDIEYVSQAEIESNKAGKFKVIISKIPQNNAK